jgi:hypothetical protein
MKKLVFFLFILLCGCATKQHMSYKPNNHEAPTKMSNQVEYILSKYKGNILHSEDVKNIDLTDIHEGTIYEYKSTSAEKYVYKYAKNESGFYYFDVDMYYQGRVYPSIYRTNGYVSEIANIEMPNDFSKHPADENNCKFVIGDCEYTLRNAKKNVNISYKNGVWTARKQMGGIGVGYLITKKIYDKNGVILYRAAFSNRWPSGKHEYTIRIN